MSDITSLDTSALSTQQMHAYLLAAVAPRPIAFASTIDKDGKVNLSPFSYFNVFSTTPPVMIFSPARSGRDNSHKHSYLNVKEVPEVVINIVNYPIVEQMSLSSTAYARGVNEFTKSGLTEVASETIRPPRVAEAPVSFECTVDQVIELGDNPGAGNLIIARVQRIHLQNQYLKADGSLDTTKLDLVGRMGESWYTRASGDALFEIPKPVKNKGIGVDQLPEAIRNSPVLTGNNIGRLGNVEALPTAEEIATARELIEIQQLLSNDLPSEKLTYMLHAIGKGILEKGDSQKALAVLMVKV